MGLSFSTIAGFNANGAMPHYRATPESHAVIEGDGLLLIDSGGQYLGGTTDITRVWPIGDVTPAMKRDYTLVLKGTLNLSRARFPRATLTVVGREAGPQGEGLAEEVLHGGQVPPVGGDRGELRQVARLLQAPGPGLGHRLAVAMLGALPVVPPEEGLAPGAPQRRFGGAGGPAQGVLEGGIRLGPAGGLGPGPAELPEEPEGPGVGARPIFHRDGGEHGGHEHDH